MTHDGPEEIPTEAGLGASRPFLEVVEQARELARISRPILIRGERGTAKSTAARALAAILPEIDVIEDDPFSCDPSNPAAFTDELKRRAASGEQFHIVKRTTRFVNLPVSATEDRVVGTKLGLHAPDDGARKPPPRSGRERRELVRAI